MIYNSLQQYCHMSREIILIIACNNFEGFQHLLNFIFLQTFNSIRLV
jgi:hypothetical protein